MQIEEFLKYFASLPHSGLLVLEDADLAGSLKSSLDRRGFVESRCWQEALLSLAHGLSTFIFLPSSLDPELYDLIAQYQARSGAIHIFDRNHMRFREAVFDPSRTHLLLIVSSTDLDQIERFHPLKQNVGLIEKVAQVN